MSSMAGEISQIADAHARQRVRIRGRILAVTYGSYDAQPSFTARVTDPTGSISLLFMGRRDVAGLTPGRLIAASGMVAYHRDRPVIFNPEYELLPEESDE